MICITYGNLKHAHKLTPIDASNFFFVEIRDFYDDRRVEL